MKTSIDNFDLQKAFELSETLKKEAGGMFLLPIWNGLGLWAII
jgi:hypothetical protein|tara:strand:+ start:574 stop:702 length:129 start_codon:yes stop_codon:yes gene_type:complete